MNLLLAVPEVGITFLIVLLVMVFFQIIIHNGQETKRFKKLVEELKLLNEKIEKLYKLTNHNKN